MGYAGGQSSSPTYHNMGDHTETLQIEFNPEKISYDQIMEIFWAEHNPFAYPYSTQYRAVVFYHSPGQKEIAEEIRDEFASSSNSRVHTPLEPFIYFYQAEDYHQKYYLQGHRLLSKELQNIYPDFQDFNRSTAAARINGYLMGYGSTAELESDLPHLGLSSRGEKELITAFQRRN